MSRNDDVPDPLADLQRRATEAVEIADNRSLPAWQRVLQTLQAFSGLQLTGLPRIIKRDVETHFIAVNQVLADYHLEKGEDYERMAEPDLQEILDIVKDLAASVAPAR
jgi:hypothetical protein